MTRGIVSNSRGRKGFTLVEMLVSLTILIVVMTIVAVSFTQALRAVRQGQQAMEAFEETTGIFAVIERDLTTAFSSPDHGAYYTVCGIPIGFSFVGMARNTTNSEDINLSRVTYVIYTNYRFDTVASGYRYGTGRFEDTDGKIVRTYSLIRYVEPGLSDLDSFPVDWKTLAAIDFDPETGGRQPTPLTAELDYVLIDSGGDFLTVVESALSSEAQDKVRAKKRELWIRMLGGEPRLLGDVDGNLTVDDRDNVWNTILAKDPADYFVADNILVDLTPLGVLNEADIVICLGVKVPPRYLEPDVTCIDAKVPPPYIEPDVLTSPPLAAPPPPPAPGLPRNDQIIEPFFRYWLVGTTGNVYPLSPAVATAFPGAPEFPGMYWNTEDPHVAELLKSKYLADHRLPEMIEIRFTMMLESAYPSAPDFKRTFRKLVDIPAGYIRPKKTG